ncbi:MAG: ThuA domain-containing protein [Pirellulales bacterium]|nr:ThuA domain-containing protein [Pirellulales bacterium]
MYQSVIKHLAALLLASYSAQCPAEIPKISQDDLPPRSVAAYRPPRPVAEWLRTHLRVAHLPPVQWRQVDEFLDAGYNVVTANMMEKWDRVGPSAQLYDADNVKRADEHMRRFVDTVHQAGAKAVFYLGPADALRFSPELAAAHPEWRRVMPDGAFEDPPNRANIRSAYGDWVIAQLTYIAKTYGVDGFWFDGYAPVHLHTYDGATREAFREFSGGADIPLPSEFEPSRNPLGKRYLEWHEAHVVDFADRIRAAIRDVNSQCIIYVNYSANRTWYYPDSYMGEYPAYYCGAVDVPSVELYWDVPGDALYQQFSYAFMQAVAREGPAAVWIQPQGYGVAGISSPVEIELRGLEGLPWGVYPEFVESARRESYMRTHVENIRAREEWLVESEAVPYIGVVASEQTRTMYAQAALPNYFSHTLGAFRAYFERHWPVRLLTEYDLEDGDLRGVRVLVLPNVACLSDRACEVVRRHVAAGGGLIASLETSLYDENFRRRGDFALRDLFGASYQSTRNVSMRDQALKIETDSQHPIFADPLVRDRMDTAWRNPEGDPPNRGMLDLVASSAIVTAEGSAEILATFEGHPAALATEYRQGRVVYLPAGFDKAMFFYPETWIRQVLVNACSWAGRGGPTLEAEGPLMLATTFRRQPAKNRIVVHLLNDASSWGRHSTYQKLAALPEELNRKWGLPAQSELRGVYPNREEVIPLTDIRVRCREPGHWRVMLQPENMPLQVKQSGDGVEVVVPQVNMHSMVVFESHE